MTEKYQDYTREDLIRLLRERDRKPTFGLVWERDEIDHDRSINDDFIALDFDPGLSCTAAPHNNLIIEADNFDALRYLRMTHAGRIKCIYIDPPYNTGNKDFIYNDRFLEKDDTYRHSKWLEFLFRRLSLAKDLLREDGVILVSINDENRAILEVLMDGIFAGMRLGSLVWRTKDTGNDLSQRFSHVHEHVLVYAGPRFKFNGRPTDRSKFRNRDNDSRGDWSPQPLTKAHTYEDRENTYYPIQDPETGYWYPCDPNRVWAYASETEIRTRLSGDEEAVRNALAGLRSDTIETLIAKKLIYFPPCTKRQVLRFDSMESLLSAIREGRGPILPKKKTPLLREGLPDLAFWVGKPIAPGRPSRKEHWTAKPESERLAPLGSWIAGQREDVSSADDDLGAPEFLRSDRGGVATDEVKGIMGYKAFSYPKPLSLIHGLLEQATSAGDIVLDFFAGSGTTGHAVLQLNCEQRLHHDQARKFILVSNTEATSDEPDKNLCRDVCAERVRRVIGGYTGKAGIAVPSVSIDHGGEFGYLRARRIESGTVFRTIQHEQIWTALCLIHELPMQSYEPQSVVQSGQLDHGAVIYVPKLSGAAVEAVKSALAHHGHATIYSWQPTVLDQHINDPRAVFEPIPDYLVSRFGTSQRGRMNVGVQA